MEINGRTRLTGIFGYPVKHSLSPAMHNVAFRALGLDYVYLPFLVKPESLEQALRALPLLNIKGVNLTVPHKERALEFLDETDPRAALMGAVNTVKVEKGRLIGYNTDGEGFIRSLKEEGRYKAAGKRVCLLGAGGAARAVVAALGAEGPAAVVILNRTLSRAQALASWMSDHFPGLPVRASAMEDGPAVAESDLIVNTTSLGLKEDDPLPIDPKYIQEGAFCCDLIYNPPRTPLLEAAARLGAGTMNGLGMLLYQGALAFEIWTGRRAPAEIMRKKLKECYERM